MTPSFFNLDFEQAIRPTPPGRTDGSTEQLIPGWTLALEGQLVEWMQIDVGIIGVPAARLISTAYIPEEVLQGEFTLFLDSGRSSVNPDGVANYQLSQTGLIPPGTLSLRFQTAYLPFDLRLNGNALSVFDESPDDSWNAADVSAFAGQTVTMEFLTKGESQATLGSHAIDSIEFSSKPAIPEPSAFSLMVLGVVILLRFQFRAWLRR